MVKIEDMKVRDVLKEGCFLQFDAQGNTKLFCPSKIAIDVPEETEHESLGWEMGEAVHAIIDPTFDEEEASWIEANVVATIFGTILGAISFLLALYAVSILEEIVAYVPFLDTIWGKLLIIALMIVIAVVVSFYSYRVTKALENTHILERFARKKDTKEPARL